MGSQNKIYGMQKFKTFLPLLIILFWLSSVNNAWAQLNRGSDSLNYEQQREHVNQLLEDRSKRFGEFDISLQQKTGVFGIFKTKGDMQKSIDILQQVVITDNKIFLETKKLLDLKDYQSDRYAALATEYDHQVSAYMKTITKLQNENDKLREEISALDTKDHDSNIFLYLLIAVILILLVSVYQLYKQNKVKN